MLGLGDDEGDRLRQSPRRRSSYALVCPITNRIKGYPFEVVLPEGLPLQGAVLADQIKSVDRHARAMEVAGKAPTAILDAVRARLLALISH